MQQNENKIVDNIPSPDVLCTGDLIFKDFNSRMRIRIYILSQRMLNDKNRKAVR
jgi:hypothetical protein